MTQPAHTIPPTSNGIEESGEASTRCHVRIITSNAEFDALEGEWNRLIENADITIYQTFEWLRSWWEYHQTPSYRLHILLFTAEKRTIAIAPLFIEEIGISGVRFAARLRFIGAGLSDYVDIIILPDYQPLVLKTFALFLQSTVGTWDVLD
ncbi:MAG: hypothetical protein HY708_01885, partial [Ignavibacteriae bacterium]|nr:hypothetical protein [Ignavibacteriota bacterium]